MLCLLLIQQSLHTAYTYILPFPSHPYIGDYYQFERQGSLAMTGAAADMASATSMYFHFIWNKMHIVVTADPKDSSNHLYRFSRSTSLGQEVILRIPTTNKIIGTAALQRLSISPRYQLRGRPGQLKALSRWH